MRVLTLIAVAGSLAPMAPAADKPDKLTLEDRVELTRGLTAEYANAKVLLPRSKKPLELDAQNGTFDKKAWTAIAKESGPAARTGDNVQVTKVELFNDHIVMQINGGFSGGQKWYRRPGHRHYGQYRPSGPEQRQQCPRRHFHRGPVS